MFKAAAATEAARSYTNLPYQTVQGGYRILNRIIHVDQGTVYMTSAAAVLCVILFHDIGIKRLLCDEPTWLRRRLKRNVADIRGKRNEMIPRGFAALDDCSVYGFLFWHD